VIGGTLAGALRVFQKIRYRRKRRYEGGVMPKGDPPLKYYWDACVFVSFIEGTTDRLSTIESMLEDCENATIEIYTSMITIVEVAYAKAEKDGRLLSEEVEEAINKLWLPPSPIKIVELDQSVAWIARALMRSAMAEKKKLKPADAIHLATAKTIKELKQIHTYDADLQTFKSEIGVPINEPRCDNLFAQPPTENPNATP